MILLIDNYDSFVYNLYQFLAVEDPDVRLVRNDRITPEEALSMEPDAIVISPGPGKPSDAGVCIELIRQLKGRIPILGVCLGHQAIGEAFGATVTHASRLMHGKTSLLTDVADDIIFKGIKKPVSSRVSDDAGRICDDTEFSGGGRNCCKRKHRSETRQIKGGL